MQIDFSATCNVLPEYVPFGTPIQTSQQPLTLYSKASLPVVGTCILQIENPENGMCYAIPFVIIKGDYTHLLGTQASQQMQLITVECHNLAQPAGNDFFGCSRDFPSQSVARVSSSAPLPFLGGTANHTGSLTLDHIITNYADVFEGIGHMPGTLHLDIDPTVKPVVMPPRRVPLALKSKLKDELERLETLGVITKVTKPTDWVSNLVVAEKPKGK